MQASLPQTHIGHPALLEDTGPSTLARPESIYQLATWFQEVYHDLKGQQMEERGVWECEMGGWSKVMSDEYGPISENQLGIA